MLNRARGNDTKRIVDALLEEHEEIQQRLVVLQYEREMWCLALESVRDMLLEGYFTTSAQMTQDWDFNTIPNKKKIQEHVEEYTKTSKHLNELKKELKKYGV